MSKKFQNFIFTSIAIVVLYQVLILTYSTKFVKHELMRVQNEAARKNIELSSEIRRLKTELEDRLEVLEDYAPGKRNGNAIGFSPRDQEMRYADLYNLRTTRQLWQVAASDFPDMEDFNSSIYMGDDGEEDSTRAGNYSLSLNAYLTAWMYTMEIMTQASTALQQMIEPLNLSMCDLVAFALTEEYFNATNHNRAIMVYESDLSKNFVSEMGSTYRILDLLSKIEAALANENDRSDPSALVFEAYKESSVSVRHSWVLKNTIKLAMKMSLPRLQSDFAFQLAGGIDTSDFSLGEIEMNLKEVFKEFEMTVQSMEEVHEYLLDALEGDHDDVLNSKIPETYDQKVFLTNEPSSFQSVCRLAWSKVETNRNTKPDMVQSLPNYRPENVIRTFEIGSYCRVSIC